jgi:hypothetical protein
MSIVSLEIIAFYFTILLKAFILSYIFDNRELKISSSSGERACRLPS